MKTFVISSKFKFCNKVKKENYSLPLDAFYAHRLAQKTSFNRDFQNGKAKTSLNWSDLTCDGSFDFKKGLTGERHKLQASAHRRRDLKLRSFAQGERQITFLNPFCN